MRPIRVTDTILPVKMTNPRPDAYVFDMGQNFSGWVQLRVRGAQGTAVKLRHAELLYDDGTINSSTNPAKRGSYVELYGTGQGFISGAPGSPGSSLPDGTPTPYPPLFNTAASTRVFLGADWLDCGATCPQGAGQVQFSGLAPGMVGVWQVNIQIPPNVAVNLALPLVVTLNGQASAGLNLTGYNTVIYAK